MGNITTGGSAIWTPDENDNLDPEVWSATMAQSIEDGIGKRLEKQEARVSLRATTPEPFDVTGTGPDDAYIRIPLNANGPTGSRAPEPEFAAGNHVDGITLEGNIATIVTPGLYAITGQITLTTKSGTFAPHSFDFKGVVNNSVFGLPAYGETSTSSFVGGFVGDTQFLVAGDQISLRCGIGTNHVGSFHVQDALLTITMLYAT